MAIGELPMAPGLLLVTRMGFGAPADGLAVRDLRRMELDLDPKLLLQA